MEEGIMNKQEKLDILKTKVENCFKCEELVGRTKTVFGEGNPDAKIVFAGEGPGKEEDKTGRPFVGKAGQLLDNILKACGFQREEVYILNILKCRPPKNRVPLPHEAVNCRPFLDMQLKIIAPTHIVCMGTSAANYLLDCKIPISQMRGKWYGYNGMRVICTFHPAFLLRQQEAKRAMADDLKMLLADFSLQSR